MHLKGTYTENNLLKAFAGESQARNRYIYYAGKAKQEGFVQIQAVFEETSNHEKEHAKRLYKFLEGGEVEITASFPAGTIACTLENLRHAAEGETYEHSYMYPEFANVALEEGFKDIALVFKSIAKAEIYHERRFKALAQSVETGTVFKRAQKTVWRCRNCGYLHEGLEAPEMCPACDHPRAYYEEYVEKW